MRVLKYVGVILVIVIAVVIIGVYVFLQWTLPKTKGKVELKGLTSQSDGLYAPRRQGKTG